MITNRTLDKLKYDLVREGFISFEDLSKCEALNQPLAQALNSFISEINLLKFIENKLKIPYVELDDYKLDENCLKFISKNDAKKHVILPLFKIEDTLTIAMDDPLDVFILSELISGFSDYEIEPVICSREKILANIEHYYEGEAKQKKSYSFDFEVLTDEKLDSFIDELLNDCKNICNILLEPCADGIRIVIKNEEKTIIPSLAVNNFLERLKLKTNDNELANVNYGKYGFSVDISMNKSPKTINIYRGDIAETSHQAYIFAIDKNEKIILSHGDIKNYNFFLRSTEKPFQAKVLEDTDTIKEFDLSLEELAIVSSSHNGEAGHIQLVKNILKKAAINEGLLQCSLAQPLAKSEQEKIIRGELDLSPFHNNCSGKHAGMLCVCKKMGWDMENYLDENHPLQKLINNTVENYCGSVYTVAKDGCGTPASAMTLDKMTKGFLRLFLSGTKIKDAFINYPYLIAGEGRLDSEVMAKSKGKIIAKAGAGGLMLALNLEKEQALGIKIVDGNMQAREIAFLEAMDELGWG